VKVMRGKLRPGVIVCVLASWLLGGGVVFSQTQTGAINGTVSDPNGDPLPGVTVTLNGPSVMGTRTDVTGDSGVFRFPTLLPGDGYIVEMNLEGFTGKRFENIVVRLGQTTTLQATMELAAMADEIVVSGESPIVDVTSPTASTNFGDDLLANTPNSERDWAETVFQAPGVVDGSQGGYDELYSIRGGSVIANQAAIDGVPNTLPVYNANIGSGSVFETVEEVQVISGALPAEIGNVGGGFINVVTKSGGNQLSGEVGVYYQDDSLQGDNVSDDLKDLGLEAPVISDFDDWAISLGGPFVRDKLWFHVGAANKELGTAVSGFPYPNLKEEEYYFGKLTWQPTPDHNFVGVYNSSDWDLPWNGGSQFTTPEATLHTWFETEMSKVKWTGILADNLILEVDLARRDTVQANQPQEGAAAQYFDLATNVSSGAASLYAENSYRRDLGKAALSLFKDDWAGSHEFKFGVEYEEGSWNWHSYQTSPIFSHYLLAGQPLLVIMDNWAPGVTTKYYTEGLHAYAQDTWSLSDRVTLSLGLRLERPSTTVRT